MLKIGGVGYKYLVWFVKPCLYREIKVSNREFLNDCFQAIMRGFFENRVMSQVLVGVVMGSNSDWHIMSKAVAQLESFGIAHEYKVVSAHRTPDLLFEYASTAQQRGLKAIIAGAGGAAHLPGMLAAKTTIPVLGVPVPSRYLKGVDSLHSIVQMPAGIPVASFAIGEAGASNAALFAISLLANNDEKLAEKLRDFRETQRQAAMNMSLPPE